MAARIPALTTQPGLPLLAAVLGPRLGLLRLGLLRLGLLRIRLLRLRAGVRIAADTRWHGQGGHLSRAFCARPVEVIAASVSCGHPGAPTRVQELLALLAPLPRSARLFSSPQLRSVLA